GALKTEVADGRHQQAAGRSARTDPEQRGQPLGFLALCICNLGVREAHYEQRATPVLTLGALEGNHIAQVSAGGARGQQLAAVDRDVDAAVFFELDLERVAPASDAHRTR